METQTEIVLAHLRTGNPITPMVALREYGIFRLGARIWDLRQQGIDIEKRIVTDKLTKKHWASYRLARKADG